MADKQEKRSTVYVIRETQNKIDTTMQQLFKCLVMSDSATPMDYSTPGFLVLHYLLEFAQTRVHWVGDAIQPSRPLSPPSPPALNLSQQQKELPKPRSWQCKMLVRTWSNRNSHQLLMGMLNVQPLQSMFLTVSYKTKLTLTNDPSIMVFGIYPKKLKMYACRKTCTEIFVTALFIIAKTWKQLRFYLQ